MRGCSMRPNTTQEPTSAPSGARGSAPKTLGGLNLMISTMLRGLLVPLMAILATAASALAGWIVWPVITAEAIAALGGIYRGFPSILFNFCACVGAALGGATAFTLVLSLSGWRSKQGAGLAIGVAALAVLAWTTPVAWEFMRSDGRRLALAIYGVPMVWTCMLGAMGCRIGLHSGGHSRPNMTRQPTGAPNGAGG